MYPIGTKLGVSEFLYNHIGSYYGNGLVFHNHWRNGPEIVSLQDYSMGREITVLASGVDDVSAFFSRVQHTLTNPQPYSFVSNNCEHSASYVREGVASSPQFAFYGIFGLFVVGAYALSRRS